MFLVYNCSTSPHASMLGVHSGQHFKAIPNQNVDYSSPSSPLPMENVRNASKIETLHHHQHKQYHPRIIQSTPSRVVSSRELFMLQQRKNRIVSQLEKVVGKQLANAISSQVRVCDPMFYLNLIFKRSNNLVVSTLYIFVFSDRSHRCLMLMVSCVGLRLAGI